MNRNNKGFTIIELMIASTAFAVLLIVVTAVLMKLSNIYYKGIVSSNTQNVARNIMYYVDKSFQFSTNSSTAFSSNQGVYGGNKIGWLCVGNQVYIYGEGQEYNSSNQLWPNNVGLIYVDSSCPSNTSNLWWWVYAPNSQELLKNNMRISWFNISQINSSGGLYNVSLEVSYGSSYNLYDIVDSKNNSGYDSNGPNIRCITQIGDQYCATAALNTNVSINGISN